MDGGVHGGAGGGESPGLVARIGVTGVEDAHDVDEGFGVAADMEGFFGGLFQSQFFDFGYVP
jgi:hypothetical protein